MKLHELFENTNKVLYPDWCSTREEIESWLAACFPPNTSRNGKKDPVFTINDNLTVNAVGDLDMHDNLSLTGRSMGFKFGTVAGDINASTNKLKDLSWAPTSCKNFNVSHNDLTSFEGLPHCTVAVLIDNKITSFESLPRDRILTALNVCGNPITSLSGIDKYLTLTGDGMFALWLDDIKDGALSLLQVKGLKHLLSMDKDYNIKMVNNGPFKIIQRYLDIPFDERDAFECQQELMDRGYEELATA